MTEVISRLVNTAALPGKKERFQQNRQISDASEGQEIVSEESDRPYGKVLRAAAYCRVSALSEEQEGSFETQMMVFEKKITEAPNLTLVNIYGDHGISGGDTRKRKQFQQMMEDCREGRIDVILTKSISRFARNFSDTLKSVQELKSLGIPVWFEKESINSMDSSMELLLGVLSAVAQEELNDLSRNIKWSFEKSTSSGNPKGCACYGYRKCMEGDRCLWKICEPEEERIRYAFQMAEKGEKYWKILDGLQRMEEDEKTGVQWNRKRLLNLLRNEAYIGNLLTNRYVNIDCLSKKETRNCGEYTQYYLEDHHESMISRERYEKVQENIRNGVLRSRPGEDIPARWRSDDWKKRHGLEKEGSAGKGAGLERGCYSRTRGGETDVRCIYGKTDCTGW